MLLTSEECTSKSKVTQDVWVCNNLVCLNGRNCQEELLEMLSFINLFRPLDLIRTSATLRGGSPNVFSLEKITNSAT